MLGIALAVSGCWQASSGDGRAVSGGGVDSKDQSDDEPRGVAAPRAPAPTLAAQRDAPRETPVEFGSTMAKAHPDQARAMLAAARKTWEATNASYEIGTTTLANVHYWSLRLLLAERALAGTKEQDLAALLDYWKRTKKTYLKVRALYNSGTRGGQAELFGAASYYVAEAELWLLDAGGAIPDEVD